MFEKEAEEIAKDIYIHHFDDDVNYPDVLKAITVGVQKGAEHGYNKANEELEEKISVLLSCKNCPENKDGLICRKEYENKCLAQKIQFIKELQQENAELKARLNAINQLIPELEKENAELKGQVEISYEVYNDNLDYSNHIEEQLTKAKKIIKNLLDVAKFYNHYRDKGAVMDIKPIYDAEQFLKEVV